MSTIRQIDVSHVRRLNITRQHLDGAPRPAMLDVIRDLGCLQLDPISAVQRSHLTVLWSRLGQYNIADYDALVYEQRALFEYWAHVASFVLTEDYPIHNFRMQQYPGKDSQWGGKLHEWLAEDDAQPVPLRQHILARFEAEGALPSRAFEDKTEGSLVSSGWTSPGNVSRMLDYLWQKGEIMVARRQGIQRYWDLAARCMPEWTPRETLTATEVTRRAAQKAIRALGVARPDQINQHYTRFRYTDLPDVLAALVAENTLEQVQIIKNGKVLPGNWYLHSADVPLLERIQAGDWQPRTTLLSPFDNLICDRKRLAMLFDFDYSVEIYVPQDKRKYGYYVLPILHGDALIGRIDPRYDRAKRELVINSVHAEPNAPTDAAAVKASRKAIADLAAWLGAKTITMPATLPRGWAKLKG
jgi:uncharacterized protein